MSILMAVNYVSYCSRPSSILESLSVLFKNFISKHFFAIISTDNVVNIQIVIRCLWIVFMIIKLPGKNLEELLFL